MKDSAQSGDAGGDVAFLVGAGRSGTTLLYKILCLHPDVGYISNYDERLPWLPSGLPSRLVARRSDAKLEAWFNQGGNAYFVSRPGPKRLFPTPVEGESLFASCGMPLFPSADYRPDKQTRDCLRRRFSGIRKGSGACIMLCKRTANNRRLRQLEAVFPAARYIHVIRDGRDVAHSLSLVEWWDGHTVWWDGRTAAQMEEAGEQRLTVCARNWVKEMNEIHAGLACLASDRVLELRYEELLADPAGELGKIVRFLGIPPESEFFEAVESLELTHRPGAWPMHWSPLDLANVMHEARPLLLELGYIDDAEP